MWLTLAVGVVLGYFFATSPLPLAVWSVVADIPRVENKVRRGARHDRCPLCAQRHSHTASSTISPSPR